MNLVQAAEMAMGLSDPQLNQALQTGTIPQFVVAAELTRRKKTRESLAGPQSTVVQELMAKANQQMPPAQPPFGQEMQPPQPQPQQGMYRGGPVGMKAGDVVEPAAPAKMNDDPEYWIKRFLPPAQVPVTPPPDLTTQNFLDTLLPAIAEQRARVKGADKNRLNKALMNAGFAMMASKSPHVMGGIGEGGQAGLGYYEGDRQNTDAGLLSLLQQEAQVRGGQQQSAEQLANRKLQVWDRNKAGDIVNTQGQQQNISMANREASEMAKYNLGEPDRAMQRAAHQSSIDRDKAMTDAMDYTGGEPGWIKAFKRDTGRLPSAAELKNYQLEAERLRLASAAQTAALYRQPVANTQLLRAQDEYGNKVQEILSQYKTDYMMMSVPLEQKVAKASAMAKAVMAQSGLYSPEIISSLGQGTGLPQSGQGGGPKLKFDISTGKMVQPK